jgi:DNA replication protein DnaC
MLSELVSLELVSVRFLDAHRHVYVLGPLGVGKTLIANALGHHIACLHGYNARGDQTLRRLRQSRFGNSRDAEMIALTTVNLLILDLYPGLAAHPNAG